MFAANGSTRNHPHRHYNSNKRTRKEHGNHDISSSDNEIHKENLPFIFENQPNDVYKHADYYIWVQRSPEGSD